MVCMCLRVIYTNLFIIQLSYFLSDGINQLYLTSSETHKKHDTVTANGELVDVMACRTCPLVKTLVNWFRQICRFFGSFIHIKIQFSPIVEADAITESLWI